MKIHHLTLVAFASVIALSGCSSKTSLETKVEELTSQVDTLSFQVSNLQEATMKYRDNRNMNTKLLTEIADIKDEVTTIFASSALAYDEASRANSRIDNMAKSYTK